MRGLAGMMLAALLLALPGPAVAETTDAECTSGPAYAASADRPHRVDAAGDAGSFVYESQLDLRAIWVGVEEATPGSRVPRYTINALVASLDEHPVGAVYYLGIDDYTWASAAALADGAWEFGIGQYTATGPFGAVFTRLAPTEGSVDVTTATVRIEIPAEHVPGPHTVPYGRSGMRGGVAHTLVPAGGFAASEWFVAADTTFETTGCTAVLNGLGPES